MIYFLVCSLLMYRNATEFPMLILYLATLLTFLIIFKSFVVVFLGPPMYSITSVCKWGII